jgi:outer membrane receptor protein involved in Fe transport
MTSGKKSILMFCIITILIMLPFGIISAEQQEKAKETPKKKNEATQKEEIQEDEKVWKYEVTVTATGVKKETFETPKPVSIVTDKEIGKKAPNNISELMTQLPGLDTVGVGANQSRPVIRGLRGQRILLMEDGIRMNNSRRQQDFGEIPAMVDISEVSRLEVVRGPASVLYGSDAIGGVVNIITKVPEFDPEGTAIHGNIGYRFGSADTQHKGTVNVNGHVGKLGFVVNGNYRKSNDYTAPAGTFGQIDLAEDTTVTDTGVQDNGINILLDYWFSRQSNLSFKFENYQANDAGFGYVDPALYDPGSTTIRILYPSQRVNKYTVRYENSGLNFLLADHLNFTAYHRRNKRNLAMNVFVPFNIPYLPDAGLDFQSTNFTDIKTTGFRLELRKVIFRNHVLTYGVDFFNDDTFNTDTNTNTVVGFGPPTPQVDNTPELPNARYNSLGFFIQNDIPISRRSSLVFGLRHQSVTARTRETAGLEEYSPVSSTDQTLVGAANFIQGITDNLNLFVSVGRGFRSPNLIERFYNGFTPEGSAFQSRNTELKAETSLNFDVGLRYRLKSLYLESSYFWNTINDGIRVARTGSEVNGLPEYQNINVDKLRIQGIEMLGRLVFRFGLSVSANYTHITSKDIGNPEMPYTDTFSSKLNLNLRFDDPRGLFWLDYNVRHHGDQKDVVLGDNPIGDIIPGFTVHNAGVGLNLFRKSATPMQLGIVVANLTNALYSEFANATFFRPAPRRHLVLTWSLGF